MYYIYVKENIQIIKIYIVCRDSNSGSFVCWTIALTIFPVLVTCLYVAILFCVYIILYNFFVCKYTKLEVNKRPSLLRIRVNLADEQYSNLFKRNKT